MVEEDGGYRVAREIREMVVFAPQNVIMDPPFTRLDILCCRNLLIYFGAELQKKLLPLFHYSRSATKSLIERRDVVIVATVLCIYGIGDRDEYHNMILTMRVGDKLDQRAIIKRLSDMQYERSEMDFHRGTFRLRGDVIDIFPAEHAEHAIRVSLFDDGNRRLAILRPIDRAPSP